MGGGASKPKTPPVFKLAMTKLSPPDNLINKFLDSVVTGHPGPGKALTKLESSDPDVEAKFSIDTMTFELSRPSNPGDPYSAVVIVSTVPASDEILAKVAPIKKAFYAAGDYILLLVGDDPAAVEQFTTSNKIRHVLQVSSIEDKGITEFIYNCAITINQGIPATTMSTPRK